jgi:hypothetical protein
VSVQPFPISRKRIVCSEEIDHFPPHPT